MINLTENELWYPVCEWENVKREYISNELMSETLQGKKVIKVFPVGSQGAEEGFIIMLHKFEDDYITVLDQDNGNPDYDCDAGCRLFLVKIDDIKAACKEKKFNKIHVKEHCVLSK